MSENRVLGEKMLSRYKEGAMREDFTSVQRQNFKLLFEFLKSFPPEFVPFIVPPFFEELKYFKQKQKDGKESEEESKEESEEESKEECEEESEDECEEESKEKSKERSLTQNNWLKKSFDFLLLSAEFVVECKKAYDTAKVAYEKGPVNACLSFLADGVISENKSKTFTEIEKMPLRDYIKMCKKKFGGRTNEPENVTAETPSKHWKEPKKGG